MHPQQPLMLPLADVSPKSFTTQPIDIATYIPTHHRITRPTVNQLLTKEASDRRGDALMKQE